LTFSSKGEALKIIAECIQKLKSLWFGSEFDNYADSPPVYGKSLSYQIQFDVDGNIQLAKYIFNIDILDSLAGCVPPVLTFPWDNDADKYEVFIDCVENRDEKNEKIHSIPSFIDFQESAFDMLTEGVGELQCTECGGMYAVEDQVNRELLREVPEHGWHQINYTCPEGHLVCREEYKYVVHKPLPKRQDIPQSDRLRDFLGED